MPKKSPFSLRSSTSSIIHLLHPRIFPSCTTTFFSKTVWGLRGCNYWGYEYQSHMAGVQVSQKPRPSPLRPARAALGSCRRPAIAAAATRAAALRGRRRWRRGTGKSWGNGRCVPKRERFKGCDLASLEKMIVSSPKKHDFSKSKMFLWKHKCGGLTKLKQISEIEPY